jgi:transmembrane sensor
VVEHEKAEEAAARWVAREDRGFTAGESADLEAWLNEADANRIAYLRLRTSWESTTQLSALRPEPRVRARLGWAMRLGMVGAVAALLFMAAPFVIRHDKPVAPRKAAPVVFATGASKRPVLLPDGTRIQLNAMTRVETSITGTARTVKLDRGEAYFDVVHEQKRPFVVVVGNRRITDLGTKFSVLRDKDSIRVVVTEGRVKIDMIDPSPDVALVYAGSGDVVIAKADETLVTARSDSAIQDALSWRSEMLTFNQVTLEQAAAQFNKYNRRHIIVRGSAKNIRIGGSFRSENLDAFAYLVQNALGLKVTKSKESIVISN